MAIIRFKRGSLAQIDAAAASGLLREGEPYYITGGSDDVLAVGTGPSSYVVVSGGGGDDLPPVTTNITVDNDWDGVTVPPGTPPGTRILRRPV